MSSSTPILSASDLHVSYGPFRVLENVSLNIYEGEALAVIGANGAGKSTLARALSGIIDVADGHIRLDGVEITNWSANQIFRAGMTHLPEGRGIFQSMSVAENLRLAVRTLPNRSSRSEALDRIFETFPILNKRRNQTAGTLSGGEQQMLSLARALAHWPKVLIADEMGLGLAPMIIDQLYEQLDKARQQGLTIMLIEQYLDRALAFADQAVVFDHGSIAWSGPVADADVNAISRRYMGQATLHEGPIRGETEPKGSAIHK
ncbi:MAG TPA: ABC transporter ATP-binding protein [Acidimicrobiales bacterium]|jgi:branched-chain amino acid transport system ATP-binding protein|nr:ABC transporter ATP-binding protein [Acidimicrobiales bacterium]